MSAMQSSYRRMLVSLALFALPLLAVAKPSNSLAALEWNQTSQGGGELVLSFVEAPAPMPTEVADGLATRFVFADARLAVPAALRVLTPTSTERADSLLDHVNVTRAGDGSEVTLTLRSGAEHLVLSSENRVTIVVLDGGTPTKGDQAPSAQSGELIVAGNASLWANMDDLVTIQSKPRLIAQADAPADAQPMDESMAADPAMNATMDAGMPMDPGTEAPADDLLAGVATVPMTEQRAFLPPLVDPDAKFEELFGQPATTRIGLDETIAGKRIDELRFRDTPLQDALRLIATRANLNILFSSEEKKVRGLITAELKNVTLGDALEAILRVNGLAAVQEGDIIQIVDRAEVVDEKVELDIRIRPINWVRAENLAATLKSFVSSAKGAEIKADRESNTLIIKDTQKSIVKILSLVDRLDLPEKQVMIEVRLVDFNLTMARSFGIDWNLIKPDRDSLTQIVDNPRGVGDPYPDGDLAREFYPALSNLTATGSEAALNTVAAPPTFQTLGPILSNGSRLDVDGGGANLGNPTANAFVFNYGEDISLFGNDYSLEAALGALEDRDIVSVLTNPKVVTLNNVPAKIEVLRNLPYFDTTIDQTGLVTSTAKFEETGITVDVVPNITNNDFVRMEISALQTISRGQEFSPIGDSSAFVTDDRTAQTNVIVRDESTVVLGGLRSLDMINNETGIPWVNRAPVIGWLFKNSDRETSKTELMLFVKPRIVKDTNLSQQEQSRFDEIDMSWVLPDHFFDDAQVVPEDFFQQF